MSRHKTETRINPLTQTEQKICSRCGEEKDIENYYGIRGRHKSGYGTSPWCKQCVSTYRKDRNDKRIVVNPRNGLEEIQCPHCQQQKPVSEFYRVNYAYSRLCKVCVRTSHLAAAE
jgi:hypothetical protein